MLSANFKRKRTAAASRGFLAAARLSCYLILSVSVFLFFCIVFVNLTNYTLRITANVRIAVLSRVNAFFHTFIDTLIDTLIVQSRRTHAKSDNTDSYTTEDNRTIKQLYPVVARSSRYSAPVDTWTLS